MNPQPRQNTLDTVSDVFDDSLVLYCRTRVVIPVLMIQAGVDQMELESLDRVEKMVEVADRIQLSVAPVLASLGDRPPRPVGVLVQKTDERRDRILRRLHQVEDNTLVLADLVS